MTEATESAVDEQVEDELFDGVESNEEWDDLSEDEEEGELPPRKRNRLMAPLSLALMAVFLFVTGLLAGVIVQQGSGEGAGAGGLPSDLPSLLAEGDAAGGGAEGSGGVPSGGVPSGFPGGSSNAAASGTVSSVDGHTIYVKESDGGTVAVKVEDGSKISRDANVSVKKVHPGDSVVVQGSKHGSTVKASSISATESGVEGGGSIELFGE